jgi:four helix bundle protein
MEVVRVVEDLLVFRRGYEMSLLAHKASLGFPAIEQRALADQLRRSSKSICANLAEGFAKQRQSKAEFRRYLIMAMGSSDETRLWLRYAIDLGYVDAALGEAWQTSYQEVSKMLRGLLNSHHSDY